MTNHVLLEALDLASEGIPVFPCGPDKAPRVAGGFKSASTDPDVIQSWNWDGALIGRAIREGEVVIDIDPRNGGDNTVNALMQQFPETREHATRSGGTHLFFRVPEDITLRPHLGPGVDVKRAGKGYVIAPPSEGYRVVAGGEPADAPDWLLDELVVTESEKRSHEASDPKYFRWENGTPYGHAALLKQIGSLALAADGERNATLNKAAFALGQLEAGGELAGDYAFHALAEEAARVGLAPKEIEATIESGRTAGNAEPWQAPETELGGGTGGAHTQPWVAPDETSYWLDWSIDEPELPFFCWPVLPRHAYVLVYGATEASKSMAWVQLLAQGSHQGLKTSVYSLENPPSTDRKRLSRIAPDPAHFRLTNEHLDFNDGRQVEALLNREKRWPDGRSTDVIMIDTYSHAFNSRSEDGNAKAIEFARVVRYVMQVLDCSVVVIDHTGYQQPTEPRDASAKRQQVDVAILMEKIGAWAPGQPSRFSMDNKKAARFANPFFLNGEIRDTKGGGLELGWIGDAPEWRLG